MALLETFCDGGSDFMGAFLTAIKQGYTVGLWLKTLSMAAFGCHHSARFKAGTLMAPLA